jgi:hypothetical protein
MTDRFILMRDGFWNGLGFAGGIFCGLALINFALKILNGG